MALVIKPDRAEEHIPFTGLLRHPTVRLQHVFALHMHQMIRRSPTDFRLAKAKIRVSPVFGRTIRMVKAKQPKGPR